MLQNSNNTFKIVQKLIKFDRGSQGFGSNDEGKFGMYKKLWQHQEWFFQ